MAVTCNLNLHSMYMYIHARFRIVRLNTSDYFYDIICIYIQKACTFALYDLYTCSPLI